MNDNFNDISNNQDDNDKARKIESLRSMIVNAEKTIQSAKAMLLQIEGKKKAGRKRKFEDDEDGEVVEGTFDGQIMIGSNGKQYPVPANYASKSKLVEGDMLKLTITQDGSFVYKQIGPVERRHLIGIVSQDEKGNFYIFSEGKPYKVLLASITYFKAEPGDEVAILTSREIESSWASIENVLQKGGDNPMGDKSFSLDNDLEDLKKEIEQETSSPQPTAENDYSAENNDQDDFELKVESEQEDETQNVNSNEIKKNESQENFKNPPTVSSLMDEWTSDIGDLEKEIKAQE